ncbi:DUF389 domain-containing protein [Cyanobium gracile]|uniref:DUF389 domain-containing protein n=1 Tax=Cyanobium gracile UHCC 0281 TaxID=3110309 RepID=A0ABU5SXX4_9CYAN|nr:DUF389 domain-containing protein [Cyanobium gracile]MEA5443321.1 DUF389 domain-containing protein [Cyanobium gracile UHCC 0281]
MTVPEIAKELLPREAESVSGIGAWGVRNYHTMLEQRAIAGSTRTGGYIAMVVAATEMATAGRLLNSAAGVIGACVSALITFVLRMYVPNIAVTPEILIRAMPSLKDVVLSALIAVSAGAAASLALIAHPHTLERPWGHAVDVVIGVQVAISPIPPAAVIGIGWALAQPEHSWNAVCLLLLNVVALDSVGSIAILAISGVRRRHLDLEKNLRFLVASILGSESDFIATGSSVDVTLLGERDVVVDVRLCCRLGGAMPETLADQFASDLLAKISCQADITVEVIPMLSHLSRRH